MTWESKIGYLRPWERESIRDQLAKYSETELEEVMVNVAATIEEYLSPPVYLSDADYLFSAAMDLVSILSGTTGRILVENVENTSLGWKLFKMVILDGAAYEEIVKILETEGT